MTIQGVRGFTSKLCARCAEEYLRRLYSEKGLDVRDVSPFCKDCRPLIRADALALVHDDERRRT